MKLPAFIESFIAQKSSDEEQQLKEKKRQTQEKLERERQQRQLQRQELEKEKSEAEKRLAEEKIRLESLVNELQEISANLLTKLTNFLRLKKLRAEVVIGRKTFDELDAYFRQKNIELDTIEKQETESETSQDLKLAEQDLQDFYERQLKLWAEADYTLEEISELFTEEHLASLDLDEYALLMKRFPSEMVTHVTRQGVRDHQGHMFHSRGLGEYSQGFESILADGGRLRSPLGIQLTQEKKEQAIARYLGEDAEIAKSHLSRLSNIEGSEPGSYQDAMAIHFAAEEVADVYYGSERGNEIFFVYPSAFIASQYHFQGNLDRDGGGYWNDQWVWANEEHGISLDAGLVFIPSQTPVDRKTGSRYELDQENKPIINQEYINLVKKLLGTPQLDELINLWEQAIDKLRETRSWGNEREKLFQYFLKPAHQILIEQFNIQDERLRRALLAENFFLQNLKDAHEKEKTMTESDPFFTPPEKMIKKIMQDSGILYRESTNTVTAYEYWTEHFNQHPDKKPSKIVFYRESDPTTALIAWKEREGLRKKSGVGHIGFEQRQIDRHHEIAKQGADRVLPLLTEVYRKHFENSE